MSKKKTEKEVDNEKKPQEVAKFIMDYMHDRNINALEAISLLISMTMSIAISLSNGDKEKFVDYIESITTSFIGASKSYLEKKEVEK